MTGAGGLPGLRQALMLPLALTRITVPQMLWQGVEKGFSERLNFNVALNTLRKNWLPSSIISPFRGDKRGEAGCENSFFQQPAGIVPRRGLKLFFVARRG